MPHSEREMEMLMRWCYAVCVLFGQQYVAAVCAMGVEELWIKQGRASIAEANQNSVLDNIGVDGFHRAESSEPPSVCRSGSEHMAGKLGHYQKEHAGQSRFPPTRLPLDCHALLASVSTHENTCPWSQW
jgi:hypothetical protein